MMIFACVEKGERLRRVFFQNSKIPNLSLISAFRTFTQTTIRGWDIKGKKIKVNITNFIVIHSKTN